MAARKSSTQVFKYLLCVLFMLVAIAAVAGDSYRDDDYDDYDLWRVNGDRRRQRQRDQPVKARPNKQNKPPQQQQQQQGGGAGNSANKSRPKKPIAQKQQQVQQAQKLENLDGDQGKYITKNIPNVGRVRGRIAKSRWTGKNIMQFVDIPYGKPPVGSLRFKASVPADPWKDVLPAHKIHPGCPSIQDLEKFSTLESNNVVVEDCLRLTINSKSLTDEAPVMVYIHGDFLYDGNTLEAAPGFLLEEDIVLVAIRYRLGPFGFLSTMSEDIPGNAAVHDIILALQWIQNHIAEFGGDASRVTLFGQVAGSALINVLTMSPAVPDGLFHRVIYHSSSALSPAFITDTPITATKDIARFAGCKNVNKIQSLNKCIRQLNATSLLEAFNAHGDAKASLGIGAYGGVQIVIGGPSGILPDHPGKLLAADKFKAYPTMGGSVKNGGTFILKDIYIDIFNETVIDDVLDGNGYIEHIIQQTNGADPTGAWKKYAEEEIFTAEEVKNGTFYSLIPGLIDMCSTIPFKNPVLLAMQANAKKLPWSTFLYSFDYGGETNRYTTSEDESGEMPFDLGVSLTDENLYLFPWPTYHTINSANDIKVAKRMVALWTSFATNGIPTAKNTPSWPPMTKESGPYYKIDKTITIGNNYLEEYSVTVKEARRGFNLVNEEFFDSLVDISNAENKNGDDDDHADGLDEGPRRSPIVIIAQKDKSIKELVYTAT